MKPFLALLDAELRSHLPALAAALGLVAASPVTHRLLHRDEPFWGSAWAGTAAAIAVLVVAPVFGLVRAAMTWSADRAYGTLTWRYARPVPASAIFAARAAAVIAAQAALVAAALAVHGIGPARVAAIDDLYTRALILAGMLALAASIPFGLFFSALASTPGRAAAGAVFAAPCLLLGTMALIGWLGEIVEREHWFGRASLAMLLAAPLVAALWALRRAPADRRRHRRGWVALATCVAATMAFALALATTPGYDADRVVAVRSLGAGVELHWTRLPGLGTPSFEPFLATGGAQRSLAAEPTLLPVAAWIEPASGRLAYPAMDNTWRLLEPGGRTVPLAFPAGFVPATDAGIGWSPSGRRFAWRRRDREFPRETTVLLADVADLEDPGLADPSDGGDAPLAVAEIGVEGLSYDQTEDWNALWLDDETLAIAPTWSGPGFAAGLETRRTLTWWGLLDLGTGSVEVRRFPLGWGFEAPGPVREVTAPGLRPGPHHVALPAVRRLGRTAAWLVSWEAARLIALGPDGSAPAVLHESDGALRDTLGSVGDELVWIERRPGGDEVVCLPAAGGGLRTACAVPAGFTPWFFRGAAGRWAVWGESGGDDVAGERLFACELDRGLTRLVDAPGALGFLSADVTSDGILLPGRTIDLDEARP